MKFIFTKHAAERWFERHPNLDVVSEMNSAVRCKQKERQFLQYGHRANRAYITKSGVIIVAKNGIVITVYGGKHHIWNGKRRGVS